MLTDGKLDNETFCFFYRVCDHDAHLTVRPVAMVKKDSLCQLPDSHFHQVWVKMEPLLPTYYEEYIVLKSI